jgi:hypothetical protein
VRDKELPETLMKIKVRLKWIAVVLSLPLGGLAEEVSFTDENWDFAGADWQQVFYLGREALFLQNANATLKNVEFYNGTIEFDASVSGERGFTSIRWRRQADTSGENFLIRNHKSGDRDSAQYEAFHGYRSSWQLYNADGYTTPIDIPVDTWIPFKIVVKNGSADIYVNSDVPILHVGELRGANEAGAVQLNAALAGAHISNFSIDVSVPDDLVGSSMGLPAPPVLRGAIRNWQVSNGLIDGAFDGLNTLPAELDIDAWQPLVTDDAGVVNLSEYLPAPGFNRADDILRTAAVKTAIYSDSARSVQMEFGFSDYVRIYLNRQLLYSGENRFREDDRRYQGLVNRNASVVLNLDPGRNELTMVLREEDRFGWGFQAELVDLEGLSLQ